MRGAVVVPILEAKENRPMYFASPFVTWAIIVCAPAQPNETAPPIIICRISNPEKDSVRG